VDVIKYGGDKKEEKKKKKKKLDLYQEEISSLARLCCISPSLY